jgi:sigma-B regulation protein RsbU (phosphoserine phosphatase)
MSHRKRGVDRRRLRTELDFPLTLPSGERIARERRRGGDRRELGPVAGLPLFRGLPFSAVEALAGFCEIRSYAAGEQLLAPGQPNDRLFLLIDGRLRVHIDRPDSPAGIEIGPGECAGEVSIIDGKPATAYVIAAEPSRLLLVPEARFWDELIRYPGVARNFMRLSADRFRARNELVRQAVEEHLRYESLQKELAIAAQIQVSMLPHDLDVGPDVDLFAQMLPARHVGGDFYDVFRIGEDSFYVAVGDVAGKGIPASLFVVRAMTMLRTEMLKRQSVEAAIAAWNRALCRDNDQCMFVTLAIVVFDRPSGRGRYVSAGHNALALGVGGQGFRLLPQAPGILAGIDEDAQYRAVDLELGSSDTLVLYTDGITEAMNPAMDLFTDRRLLDALNAAPVLSPAEAGARLTGAVEAFADGADQSDDLTLVVVRFR